jgi:hypothetical protein
LIGFEADYDDMASPHRSESFFQDGSASLLVLLVPIGDGDFFEVVLGPILTLVRSEKVSPGQEGPLSDEPRLITGEPSHVSISPDGQLLMIIDNTVLPGFTDSRVEDLTEQAAVHHDHELDEGRLEELLLDSPDAEIQSSESPVGAHVSPGTSHLLCYFLVACFSVHLHLYFVLKLGLVCIRVLSRRPMCLLPSQSRQSQATRR